MAPKRRKNDDDDDNHDDDHPDDDGVNMNDNGGDNDDDDADRFKVVGDFKSGSITCIKLQNFLTYSHVELRPGPRYVQCADVQILVFGAFASHRHCTIRLPHPF
jgi:hypothetical protein